MGVSDDTDADICALCRRGRVAIRNERISFHQWTGDGFLFCRVIIPVRTCDGCGCRSWDAAAEAVIEAAVQREYDRRS
jgi:hypothetical protein